jgi:hypothetical protein
MQMEHCSAFGHDKEFTTPNYNITTTPEKEWGITVNGETTQNMGHDRRIRPLDELMQEKVVHDAKLIHPEVAAVTLYTGPLVSCFICFSGPIHSTPASQYDLYNCLLRRFPAARFKEFEAGNNLFSTTIAVLVSLVQKIARVANIREGTLLYRGLSRLMELPDSFFRPDKQGRRGFAEWGFLSTTRNKDIALMYSGVKDGPQGCLMPMVMVFRSSAVDRGASIRDFSQYPQVRPAHVALCG